jgi:hypothetical protein
MMGMLLMMTGCASGKMSRHTEPPAAVDWQAISPPSSIRVPGTRTHDAYVVSIENDSSYREQLRPYWFVISKLDARGGSYEDRVRIGSSDAKLDIALVDVTGDGLEELVTRGRAGPYAEEVVHVGVLTETRFERILDLSLGPRPENAPAWYTVEFVDPDHDGVRDVLVLPARPERPLSPTGESYLYPPKSWTW